MMELKEGYKQTEIGVIPEDWEVMALGDISNIYRGASPRPIDSPIWFDDKSRIGWVRISDVTKSRTRLQETVQKLSELGVHHSRYVPRGSLIMSICATVGRPIVTDIDVCIHDGFVVFERPRISQEFLYHTLKALESNWSKTGQTGSQMNLNTGIINPTKIPIPPTKAEQEAIAGALSDADALIESLEQLIIKKRHIKQGAMQELLCPKDGWCIKKLEDIADVIDPHPSHRAPAVVLNGIPFVGIGDLNENGDLIGTKIRTVDPSVLDEHLARYNLNEELIGLGRVASIGKVVKLKYTGANYTISPTLGVIRGTKVRRDYLLYALKSKAVADQFNKIMSGSTRSSVGMVVLRKLDIALPVKETEQTAIATILSDMDAEIAALETRLSKTRALKQGMMHNLLTGRIRLPGQSMAVDLSQ